MLDAPKLVIVGNGMAAGRLIDEIFKRSDSAFSITVIGSEKRANYNRIMLSQVLSGEISSKDTITKDFNWFDEKFADFQSRLNKTADYDSIPLYIDSMSEEVLLEKLKEYEAIKLEYYTQPEIFWDGVLQELKLRKLKKLTLREFLRKCGVGAKMAITVTRKSMFHDRKRYSPASQSSLGI